MAGGGSTDSAVPKEMNGKDSIINSDIESKDLSGRPRIRLQDFQPKTREELLALDLATELNDRKGLALYLSYAKRHPEHLPRRLLGEVKEVPPGKIKQSRGALFNHIMRQHETATHHPGA